MEYKELCEMITKDYADKILGWAINKTYNRVDGEELAQDIFYELFKTLSKSPQIENLEGFIWSIAQHTFCSRARKYQKDKVLIRGNDLSLLSACDNVESYVKEIMINDELSKMRKVIANLNRFQRESMIFYYIEGC